ncbi:MAG: hypothetical protein Q7I95_06890, partial [Thiobacillus sp.]|nr:hypothetical protein [Thiobacillus sp.]
EWSALRCQLECSKRLRPCPLTDTCLRRKSPSDGETDFDGAEANDADAHVTTSPSTRKRNDTPRAGKPAG